MNRRIILTVALLLTILSTSVSRALTLDEALAMARANHPSLRTSQLEAKAAGADAKQEGAWANPELEFEVENIEDDPIGSDALEYTVQISQELSLNGKPSKRAEVARQGALAADLVSVETQREVDIGVRKAFIDALAKEESRKARTEQEALARSFLKSVQARHQKGAASELELIEASVFVEEHVIEREKAEAEVESAKQRLGRWIGKPQVETLEGAFFSVLENPVAGAVNDSLPAVQRLQVEGALAQAELVSARSERLPDISLGVGARYDEVEEVYTYLVGASIPLPLFNRNSAACDAAALRVQAAQSRAAEAHLDMEEDLADITTEFKTALIEVQHCREHLLPQAQKAHKLCQEGYEVGRYSWIEVIRVQQDLVEIRIRYIEAQRDAQFALAELSRYQKVEGE